MTENAVAVVETRRYATVHDTVPVFDSDRFAHYGRIASVMAKSSLVPETLLAGGGEQGVSNCFQVVEIADRWGMSPFAVAQCASVVFGKLVFEGKLVAAVLQKLLSVKLNHYFQGEWGTLDYRVYICDRELTAEQADVLRPHDQKSHPFGYQIIDGSVGEWHTKKKNSQDMNDAWKKQPDMQLIYRGDRTWARAFESGVMLGVLSDDEIEDFRDRQETSGPAPKLIAGFEAEKSPRKPREPKASKDTAPAAEAPSASQEAGEPAKIEQTEVVDPETGEVTERPTETDGAQVQDAEFEPATADSATTASDATPETSDSSPQATSQPTTAGEPPEDELYLLATDAPQANGMLTVYQNGAVVESAEPRRTAKLKRYAAHALRPDLTEEKTTAPPDVPYLIYGEGYDATGKRRVYKNGAFFSNTTERGAANYPVHDFHAPEVAPKAGEFGAEETMKSPPTSEGSPAAEQGAAFAEAIDAMSTAPHWLATKQIGKTLAGSPAWKAASDEDKRAVRRAAWTRYEQLYEEGADETQPTADLSLFRSFLEFRVANKAEANALWKIFWRGPGYKNAADSDKTAITEFFNRRLAELPDA